MPTCIMISLYFLVLHNDVGNTNTFVRVVFAQLNTQEYSGDFVLESQKVTKVIHEAPLRPAGKT